MLSSKCCKHPLTKEQANTQVEPRCATARLRLPIVSTNAPNREPMNAVELENVSKAFRKHLAVDGLNLQVPEGTVYGFIGPNGSGKTTTLRMILRIFFPDSGVVRVLGLEHGEAADDRIGYLPEERGLYKKMRVREVLRFHAELKGRRDCKLAIDDWLARMNLSDWADKRVETLSKGMAQKAQFIAAVIAEPQLLILDEPFSGLDPVNMEMLKDVVLDLKKRGTTVIFSTHDMDVAERMCDTIFMIFQGRKVLDGSLQSIQAKYGEDTIRVRTANSNGALDNLPGVVRVNDYGHHQELRIAPGTDSQAVLLELARRTRIEHFELARPSLHDIFVRIAGPQARARRHFSAGRGAVMRKMVILARREYQALIRTKAFIVSLVAMPIFMFGAIFVQSFLQEHLDTGEKTIVVLDGTGRLLAPLEALAGLRDKIDSGGKPTTARPRKSIRIEAGPAGPVTDEIRLELSDRIRRNEIFAFAEINANALKASDDSPLMQLLHQIGALKVNAPKTEPEESSTTASETNSKAADTEKDDEPTKKENSGAAVKLYMQTIAYNEIGQWFMQSVNQAAFALRLSDAGLNPAVVAQAAAPVDFAELAPYTQTKGGEIHKGDEGSRGVSFFVPFMLMMLMFMSVMIVGQPMLTSVIEEKQQRIAEVLLGSASPFQLMMGKLLGNVGVALTIVAIYLTRRIFSCPALWLYRA